jgi:hypothetical protein
MVYPAFYARQSWKRRTDKNEKPYFICDPCGIQLFVRRRRGIELLEALLVDIEKNEIPFKQRAHQLFKIQAVLTEIDGVKKQIKRVESQTGFFFPDEDKMEASKLLKEKVEHLLLELRELSA